MTTKRKAIIAAVLVASHGLMLVAAFIAGGVFMSNFDQNTRLNAERWATLERMHDLTRAQKIAVYEQQRRSPASTTDGDRVLWNEE